MAAGARSVLPARFDLFDPALIDDPYPVYARLRRSGPVCRGGAGQWVIPGYAEVHMLLHDRRLGVQFPQRYPLPAALRQRWQRNQEIWPGVGAGAELRRHLLMSLDPPEHTQLTRVLGRAMNYRLAHGMRERVGQLVDELLEPALATGRLDAVTGLAVPLATRVLADLIGIPSDHRDEIRPWVHRLGRMFIPLLPPDERAAADNAVDWLQRFIGDLYDARRRAPRDDLLSQVAAAADPDGPGRQELVDNVVFLCFAGYETTVNLIAGGCAALARYPDQQRRLLSEPGLLHAAVEEMVRFESPIQINSRVARADIEMGGRTLRAGRMVALLLGSANHDERRFPDPDRFDIARHPNPHVGFGGGLHHCLGAALGRLEGQVVFERITARCRWLDLAGEPVREQTPILRPRRHVPLAITPI